MGQYGRPKLGLSPTPSLCCSHPKGAVGKRPIHLGVKGKGKATNVELGGGKKRSELGSLCGLCAAALATQPVQLRQQLQAASFAHTQSQEGAELHNPIRAVSSEGREMGGGERREWANLFGVEGGVGVGRLLRLRQGVDPVKQLKRNASLGLRKQRLPRASEHLEDMLR